MNSINELSLFKAAFHNPFILAVGLVEYRQLSYPFKQVVFELPFVQYASCLVHTNPLCFPSFELAVVRGN